MFAGDALMKKIDSQGYEYVPEDTDYCRLVDLLKNINDMKTQGNDKPFEKKEIQQAAWSALEQKSLLHRMKK